MRTASVLLLVASSLALLACPRSPGHLPREAVAPSGPAALAASAGDGAVALQWEGVDGAVEYTIWRSEAAEPGPFDETVWHGAYHAVATLVMGAPAFEARMHVDGGLVNGSAYHYVVTARREGDAGSPASRGSPARSVTPAAGALACLTLAPTSVTDSSLTLNGVVVNPPGATSTARFDHGATEIYGATTAESTLSSPGVSIVSHETGPFAPDAVRHFRLTASNADGACLGGDRAARTLRTPEIVAGGLDAPFALVLGGDAVYWAERDANRIAKVAKAGGDVETVAAATAPAGLAGSDAMLYVVEANEIRRIDPGSLTSVALTTGWAGGYDRGLVLHASTLYWLGGGVVWSLPVSGGTPIRRAPGTMAFANDFDVDGGALYWLETSAVRSLPLQGGAEPRNVVLTNYGGTVVPRLVAAAGWVYFHDDPIIYRAPASGGDRRRLGASIGWPQAADSTHLYLTGLDGTLLKVPLAGGAPHPLAYHPGLVSYEGALAFDDTHVYWVHRGTWDWASQSFVPSTGAILRTPRN